MQNASALAANLLPNGSDALPSRASSATPLPAPVATPLPVTQRRTLWVRMAEIYGHRWTSAYGETADDAGAGETWAKGLAGITPEQLADGLKACVASADPWPPTLPEFRARCLGIPPLAQVRLELRGGAHSRFTLQVWQGIDSFRFKQAPSEQSDRLLRDAYELAREHVMRGGELPPLPAAAIGASGAAPAARKKDPRVRDANYAQIREHLGIDRKQAAAGETNDA